VVRPLRCGAKAGVGRRRGTVFAARGQPMSPPAGGSALFFALLGPNAAHFGKKAYICSTNAVAACARRASTNG